MKDFQKLGGVAALIEAATFIVGFVLYFTLLSAAQYGSLSLDPVRHVRFLAEHQTLMYAWNLIIYVLFGVVLVVLALALNERLKVGSPLMAQTATAFGLIWAGLVIASGMVANVGASMVIRLLATDPERAGSLWSSLSLVVNGLGGGNEIVGGLWVLPVSVAALRSGGLPRSLGWFGVVVGLGGILTVVPALGELGAVFGLGGIAWFVWLGILMLRGDRGEHRAVADTPRLHTRLEGMATGAVSRSG